MPKMIDTSHVTPTTTTEMYLAAILEELREMSAKMTVPAAATLEEKPEAPAQAAQAPAPTPAPAPPAPARTAEAKPRKKG